MTGPELHFKISSLKSFCGVSPCLSFKCGLIVNFLKKILYAQPMLISSFSQSLVFSLIMLNPVYVINLLFTFCPFLSKFISLILIVNSFIYPYVQTSALHRVRLCNCMLSEYNSISYNHNVTKVQKIVDGIILRVSACLLEK